MMYYPNFYTSVPSIKLHDPLSAFLGAFEKGYIEISYLDCVKLAGHSCPTVAGAFLMASKGLSELYGNDLPSRGQIKVEMKNEKSEGVTGVICAVISFIVGASDTGGFKGIQGHFSRNNLIDYATSMKGEVSLIRTDTNQSVSLSYNPSMILPHPQMQPLMIKNIQGTATEDEKKQFETLWQDRVEKILLSTDLHDQMITIYKG